MKKATTTAKTTTTTTNKPVCRFYLFVNGEQWGFVPVGGTRATLKYLLRDWLACKPGIGAVEYRSKWGEVVKP